MSASRIRIALAVALALPVLLVVLALLVHTGPVQRYVLRSVEDSLATQGVTLDAREFSFNLFSGSATLDGAAVASPGAAGMPPFAALDSVRAEFDVWSLFTGTPVIHRVDATNLRIRYQVGADGRDNLPRLSGAAGGARGGGLRIATARLTASLEYEDRVRGIRANIPVSNIEADGVTENGAGAVRVRVGPGGWLSAGERRYPLDGLRLAAAVSGEQVRVTNLEVQSGASSVKANGTLTAEKIDAAARVEMDAAMAGPPLEGRLNAELGIRGPLKQPAIEMMPVTLDSAHGRVEARGTISTAAGSPSKVTGEFSGVDVAHFARILQSAVAPTAAATGTISAEWPGLDYRQGSARVTATLVPRPGALPVSGGLVLDAANGGYRIKATSLRVAATEVNGAVSLGRGGRLEGAAQVIIADLAAAAREARKLQVSGLPELRGSGRADLTIGGTLNRPEVQAAATVQQGDLRIDANVAAAGTEARLENSVLSFRGREVGQAAGQLNPLDVTARAGNVPLADVLAMAAMRAPVDGRLSGTFHLTKDGGNGHATVSGLKAYEENLGELNADVALKGSALSASNVALVKPSGGEVRGQGSYDFDSASFAAKAEGTDLNIEGLRLENGTAAGKASFTLEAEGNGSHRRADGTFTASGARWNGSEIGQVEGTANLIGDGLTGTLQLKDYGASARIRMGLEAPYPAGVEAKLDGTDLKKLPLETPIDGSVTATLAATGDLDRWQDAVANGEIAAIELRRGEARVTSSGPARFSYRDRTATLEPLTLSSGQSRVTVRGQVPAAGSAAIADLQLEGSVRSEDARAFLTAFGKEAPEDVSGTAAWNVRLRGPWKQFTPEGKVSANGAWGELKLVELEAAITPQALEIAKLNAVWNQAPIEGSGSLPLSLVVPEGWLAATGAGGPGRVRLAWKNMDLAPLMGGANGKLGGVHSGEAEIEVKGFSAREVGGKVTLNPLDLKLGELALSLKEPAELTLTNGVARIERLRLEGTAGKIDFKGEAGLLEPRPIRLEAAGGFDASLVAAFTDQVTATGDASVQLLITGTAAAPAISGFIETASADAVLPAFKVQAEGIKSRIDFDGDNVKLTTLNASVNGGTLYGTGEFRLVKGTPEDVRLNFTAANVFVEYPGDLKTAVSAALGLRSNGQQYNLTGDIQILDGSYTENINFDQFLLRSLTEAAEAPGEESSLPRRLRFNVGLRTASPILVNNNLGKAAVNADLKLLGTYASPGLAGRLTLEEGGELRLNERTYTIERGVVTFAEERRIKPTVDLLARTQVSGHDITLQVQGEQGALESKLTSEPALPESDIVALLVTGRTLDRLSGAEADVTKEQVLSYLATRVGGELTRTVERTFGLSQVRIQPNLIAAESDPSARLTVGQDIARQVRLTYSMDLGKSNDQLWLGEWDATRRFRLRGFKDFDNTYRFEFRHELQFGEGGAPLVAQAPTTVRKLGTVGFDGNFYVTAKELAERAKLRSGARHDFFNVRKATGRLEDYYRSRNFHEARIRTERNAQAATVDLLFRIREGSEVAFVYEGWMPPSSLRKQVVRTWQQGVFDTGRILASLAVLRGALFGDGYLQAAIRHQVRQPAEGKKQVLFEIQRGAKFDQPVIVVEGAAGLPAARIKRAVSGHRPKTDLFLRPPHIAETVQNLYRSEGFLEASVTAPRLETDTQNHTARLVLAVKEGRRFSLGLLRFAGNAALDGKELTAAAELEAGSAYRPARIEAATQNLLAAYAAKGYNDAEVELVTRRGEGTVEVEFRIDERRQAVLQEVLIRGNRRTSANLVRTQAHLRTGDVVNAQKFSDARRNLYATGAYSLVEIETEEVTGTGNQKLLRATINVRELTPFSLKYGGFYDTERGPGVIFDFVTRSYLRSARTAGIRGRYDSQLQEVRGYFSQPLLRRFPVGTTSTVYFRRELHETFIADRTGASVVQESRFKKHYILNYGYRFEKTHTYDRVPDEFLPFDITLRVAPLQMTLTRENRDDILDATRGSFLSQSLEYAPKGLGSELRFVRYYGQYFHYLPLTGPSEIPWSGGARRPRVIYAAAVRVGMAKGLDGQDLVPSERFYAGGGTSVRGFGRDMVGPLDRRGDPTGGTSLFVTNHEVRFPAFSIFEGVGFLDAGNVFPTVSAWRPWDVRTSGGFGIRLRTPYLLFRLDYGVNLDRRTGEPFGRWFFSVGQTF